MPLQNASDIVNYTGNAGLALGGASDVPVVGLANTDELNKTFRELALNNFAKNRMLYEAHRQDLADVRKMIDEGQVSTGNILEHDRPIVQDAKNKVWDVYNKYDGNLLDPKNYAEYKKAVNYANEVSKQAQKNYMGIQGDLEQKKNSTNPYDQSKIDGHIQSQMGKGFWADYNPYAPVVDFDLKTVQQPLTYGQENVQRTGDYNITSQKLDTGATIDKYQKTWLLGQNREQFNRFANEYFTSASPDKIAQDNQKLDAINKSLGLTQGDRGYLTPISATDPSFLTSAKLGMIDGQAVLTKKEFAKDEVGADLKRAELGQANVHFWAQLGLEKEKLKDKNMEDLSNANSVLNEASSIINKGVPQTLKGSSFNGGSTQQNLISDPTLLKTFATINKDGEETSTPDAVLYDNKKGQLSLVYYSKDRNGNAIKKGNQTVVKETQQLDERTWLKHIAARSFPNKDIGKVNAIVDAVLQKNNGSLFDVAQKLKGMTAPTETPKFDKNSYTASDGQAYSLDDLRSKYKYTDEQIQQAIKNGTLK